VHDAALVVQNRSSCVTQRKMKLATLVAAASICTVKARVALLPNYTWSNLAWGFPDGGIDTTAGAKVITVDPDFVKATAVAGYKAGGQIVSW
jgi:hypothetical protein